MKNVKFVFGFAIFGFLLSILSSFRAVARSFGGRFLVALGFALCFGVIAFLIQFFLGNFLESDVGGGESSLQGTGLTQTSGSQHPVDIVIQDEELPAEENDPQFFVGSNHQMLNSEDIQSVKAVQPASAPETVSDAQPSVVQETADSIRKENLNSAVPSGATSEKTVSSGNEGFVPFSLAENAKNFSSVESKSVEDIKKEEKLEQMNAVPDFKENNSNSDNLDVLPDLEEISEVHTAAAPSGDAGVVEDSDFSEGRNISSSSSSAEDVTAGKDTELIAKAISTLLARD